MENLENGESRKSLQRSTALSTTCTEISLYNDQPAETDHIKNECRRLQLVFPVIKAEFILIMAERIKARKMTGKQLTDAIDNLIDNFKYQHPTVADVVSWDRRIKLYSYDEAVNHANKIGGYLSEIFDKTNVNGQIRWILKD
jgi:hypothetical protein